MNLDKVLMGTAYFAPISYYAYFVQSGEAHLEVCDNYQKQTFRNRCEIYGANGKLNLNIPILHSKESNKRLQTVEVKPDHSQEWLPLHWKSIRTAYQTSPYFEYYEDELYDFFHKKHESLMELNREAHQLVCDLLQIDDKFVETEEYFKDPQQLDLRNSIHPKKELDVIFPEYTQVFSDKYGFLEDLSVLDLIFMEGPASLEYLENLKLKA